MVLDYESRGVLRPRPFRRGRALCVGLMLAIVAALVIFSLMYPGLLYRHHDEIDIRSGRIRRTDYILFLRWRQSVEPTCLTLELPAAAQNPPTPDWRRVNTFDGWRRHSPHYDYHSAIDQTQALEMAWRCARFSPQARQQIAQTILGLWQAGDSDWLCSVYLCRLYELVNEARSSGKSIGPEQLPAPPTTQGVAAGP